MTAQEAYITMLTLFAEFYKYPDPDLAGQIAAGEADNELKDAAAYLSAPYSLLNSRLHQFHTEENPVTKQYMNAFSGIVKPFHPPVESLYKPWSTDRNAPDEKVKRKGYFMGDSALHLKHLLSSYGFSVPREYENMPDHLSIELELYAFLLTEDQHAAKLFYQDHLDWIAEFYQHLRECSNVPFYQETTKLLIDLLSVEPPLLND